ncbi:hypothetical protein SNOG_14986 [Parastagonospora nodorum SN15]|uniref:Uncharacterized protein n=1 Tax=Phaeosphaeria nodorum (strain SN15 / ATCC MYA-4574 / FGSC 10173) TaxID=321614 RepID=Q0TZG9_PHANO|nr:hypothetical protein SNOG_14986 [Parastagonospora nodorum SN15]EAT77529.2 hypothetical protein SNOG_14986 [Parastagonospora nodorum SN15]
MSLAYKVEELLALRDSVSESAVSIDRFADEDVIKAEKLLKEHGSPPGMRVTAGGRIVPSDLPPLGTSRFPDNSFKPSTLRVTPNTIMSAQTQSNNNSAARIEVVGGQPVVFIGDRMFALPAVNANSTPAMGSNAIMEPSAKHAPEPPALSTYGSMPGLSYGPSRTNSTSPFAGLDLPTLKSQQSLKKQELRSVEQTEVLQASHQSEAWRANMIEKKRCLIVELDALRKSITALENENGAAAPTNSFIGPAGTAPASASLPTFVPQVQQPVSQALYPFPAASPYTPMMMYPPPYSAFPSFPGSEPTPFVAPSVNPPRSPGSASRRSHAIAIKPPQDGSIKPALNPKSPTYEPATKPGAVQSAVPPTPSPPKRSPWRTQEEPQSRPIPSTPEKHWPASPWNEGHSGRVNKNEPISKLTSWPEAFGKRQSSSSLRQSATGQHLACVLEKAPTIGSYGPELASNKKMIARSDSDQRNDTNENWPFSRKAVAHVPSTYQEGYQAGYDHVGMPDSPEVLQGYVQGLLQFLADELKRGRLDGAMRESYAQGTESRTHSLRGLIAGSMPHDSAISMTFNRNTGQSTNYENVGSSKDSLPAKMYQDSSYSAQGGIKDVQNAYALLTEAAYVSRQRNVSSMQYPSPANPIAEGPATRRPATLFSGENEPSKAGQDKGIANRADADASKTNGGFGRQFSGAQIQNRDYGTPFSNQRFYPTPKEMSPNGSGGEAATSMRPFANHRLSGLDGAMDDLADIVLETHIDDQRAPANKRAADGPEVVEAEAEEATASCFKPSGGKGKQKALGSPPKSCGNGRSNGVSSPNPPSSPKKSGELSPAKAKLEQVTNKFRRNRKDDPRTMSPEEKTRRSDKWRKRFQAIKREELEEIEEHRRNTRN